MGMLDKWIAREAAEILPALGMTQEARLVREAIIATTDAAIRTGDEATVEIVIDFR